MPKPILIKIVMQVLKDKGFFFVSQRGSHAKYRRVGNPTRTVIIKTTEKEIPFGTFRSIILQSGLQEEDFRNK